jgi:hypothetical protein
MVSAAYKQAFYAAETDDDTLTCVLIEHAALSEPIRVVHGFDNIVHLGEVYSAAAFRATLPEQDDKMSPRCTIVVENIDREMVPAVRAASGVPTMTIFEVLQSDPDTIEDIYPEMDVLEVEYDSAQISIDAGYPDLDTQAFGGVFTLSQWSAL